MGILYFKGSIQRREEFQIKTRIVDDSGKRFVEKEAVSAKAIGHILQLQKNTELAEKIYCEKYTSGKIKGHIFITPYYEAVSFGDKLRESLKSEHGNTHLKTLCCLWKDLVIARQENCCSFFVTKEFENIFGEANELIGDDAVRISNIDCTSENILFLADGNIKIIDYEWIFDFPVPIDFILYRAIKIFFKQNKDLVHWDMLYLSCGLPMEKEAIYEKLFDKFDQYVGVDTANEINFGTIGNKFLHAKINGSGRKMNYTYAFPADKVLEDSKLVIYGAGEVGMEYYNYALSEKKYHVVAWVDKRAEIYRKQGLNVLKCSALKELNYDYVLISILNGDVEKEIEAELLEMEVPKEKIKWYKPVLYRNQEINR